MRSRQRSRYRFTAWLWWKAALSQMTWIIARGLDHPDTATSVSNLALFEWVRDRTEAAAPLAERAMEITLRPLDETAAIQTEQQQFLMFHLIDENVSFWLTVSGADAKWTPAVYRDVLAWKGLITARQQGLRLALKDDSLFAEFRRVTQQMSTVALSPPLPPSDPKILAAWKAREPDLRRNWKDRRLNSKPSMSNGRRNSR